MSLKRTYHSMSGTRFAISGCWCVCVGFPPHPPDLFPVLLWEAISRDPRLRLCLDILSVFTAASVWKTHTMKVIAFKALSTIEFPVEKQYSRSVIDFSLFLPSTQKPSQQTNQLQPLIYSSDLFACILEAGNLLNLNVT